MNALSASSLRLSEVSSVIAILILRPTGQSHKAASTQTTMATRNWRLIDVDQYEDGNLTMEELVDPDPRTYSEAANEAKQKSGEVRSLLQKYVGPLFRSSTLCGCAATDTDTVVHAPRNDTAGALSVALSQPPYGSALEEARVSEHSWSK